MGVPINANYDTTCDVDHVSFRPLCSSPNKYLTRCYDTNVRLNSKMINYGLIEEQMSSHPGLHGTKSIVLRLDLINDPTNDLDLKKIVLLHSTISV